MKKNVNFIQHLLRIAVSGLCLVSTVVYADDSSSSSNPYKGCRHRSKDRLCHTQPIQVNQSQDILLEYAQTALSDLYGPLLPDLSSVYGQYNTWINPILRVNPADKNNVVVLYREDLFAQGFIPSSQRTFFSMTNDGPQIAFSTNGGKRWKQTIASLPTWLDKSGLSQNLVVGDIRFCSDGTLFLIGGFNSTYSLDPANSFGGIYVTKSIDGGASWSLPVVLQTSFSSAYNFAVGLDASGVLSTIFCDEKDVIHATWSNIDFDRSTLYGNIGYTRSLDQGKNWEEPRIIYELILDPKWVRDHGYVNESAGIPLGGQVLGPVIAETINPKSKGSVLIMAFERFYPQQGATTYTEDMSDSVADHAVIRSFDHGATWSKEAIEVGQYIFGFSHDPTGSGSFNLISTDASLNTYLAVSPKTNRVYMVWQGGNSAVSPDPEVSQNFPLIQLSVSDDAGKKWSPFVTVSRTPFNPTILNANQSFNPNIAVTKDGLVGIIYTDFRNYNGSTTFAATDIWLAIYRETNDPKGGSTGVGLNFVKEIRLTPQSFNALIGFQTNLPGIPSALRGVGASNGIGVVGNNFLTAFQVGNQSNLVPVIGAGPFGSTQDLNNRFNIFFKKVCFGKNNR